MHKFSDFAKGAKRLEGAKAHISDILNKEIIVLAFDVFDSVKTPGSRACAIQFAYPGAEDVLYVVKTGGKVLISQAEEYAEELPFTATIVKRQIAEGRSYYTFS